MGSRTVQEEMGIASSISLNKVYCMIAMFAALMAYSALLRAETRPTEGIRDNSFLVEEAFNQEKGVVQHIFTARYDVDERGVDRTKSWEFAFTQEWPVFSQDHQFSYTIPYSFVDPPGEHDSDIGDLSLNYRYQLCYEEGWLPAISPRAGLILPTGNEDRGFGTGVVGYQFNLPISKTLTDRLYINANAGVTVFPEADLRLSNGRHSDDFDLVSVNLGLSAFYAITDDVNLLLEAVWESGQSLEERPSAGGRRILARRSNTEEIVLAPGIRWAHNLPGDLQIVPGVAFPIGLSEDAVDYGVILYLSIEHPFMETED